jgi:hypothetical protein
MSRNIDYSQPLSEDDEAWASQFPSLHGGSVAANREQFPRPEGETLGGSDAEEVPYAQWAKRDLEAETKRRNTEEGTALKTTGTQAELAAQLEADDVARAV